MTSSSTRIPAEVILLAGDLSWEQLPGGESHQTWHAGGKVLRRSHKGPAARSRHAGAVSGFFRRSGLEVPEACFLHSEETGEIWSVVEYLPGTPLSDAWPLLAQEDRVRVSNEVAAMLGSIHSLGTAGFPVPPFRTLLTALDPVAAAHDLVEECRKLGGMSNPRADAVSRYLASLELVSWEMVPLHMDAHPGNVLLDEDLRVSALLDFEWSRTGDPSAELVNTMMWDRAQPVPYSPLLRDALLSQSLVREEGLADRVSLGLIDHSLQWLYHHLDSKNPVSGREVRHHSNVLGYLSGETPAVPVQGQEAAPA